MNGWSPIGWQACQRSSASQFPRSCGWRGFGEPCGMPDVHFFSFGDGRYPMWTVECFRWGNPCPLGHAMTYVVVIPFLKASLWRCLDFLRDPNETQDF
jgi:hypothetical protein